MGFLDSLKNLLGLGKTPDTNQDNNSDVHDSTAGADNNSKTDSTDNESLSTATSQPKGAMNSNTNTPKKDRQ